LVVLGGVVGAAVHDRMTRQAALEQKVAQGLDGGAEHYRADRLPDARAALKEAEELLGGGGGEEVGGRTDRWGGDLRRGYELEEVRLELFTMKDRQADPGEAFQLFRGAFHRYGLDVKALDPDDAVERLRASAIKDRLVPALDEWALTEARADPAGARKMLRV